MGLFLCLVTAEVVPIRIGIRSAKSSTYRGAFFVPCHGGGRPDTNRDPIRKKPHRNVVLTNSQPEKEKYLTFSWLCAGLNLALIWPRAGSARATVNTGS